MGTEAPKKTPSLLKRKSSNNSDIAEEGNAKSKNANLQIFEYQMSQKALKKL